MKLLILRHYHYLIRYYVYFELIRNLVFCLESMDVKTKEENDRSDSKDEKSEEEEKEVRPDSREGKDTLEGGTSTNSPTTERDERMKSMEKTDNNVKQEVRLFTTFYV